MPPLGRQRSPVGSREGRGQRGRGLSAWGGAARRRADPGCSGLRPDSVTLHAVAQIQLVSPMSGLLPLPRLPNLPAQSVSRGRGFL